MGYYTCYELLYYGSPEDEQALLNFEPNQEEFTIISGDLKQFIIEEWTDVRWINWRKDMQTLAKKFPNITFVLHGDGEESYDIWEWRGKGDKYEFHQVEMPPFTEILIP